MNAYLMFLRKALPAMVRGSVLTVEISAVSLMIGLLGGIPLAFLQVYGNKFFSKLCAAFAKLFRGTPLLVQLFLVYFGLPQFGITFSPTFATFLTLGVNSAAYQMEYIRGAIISVGDGQMMTARAMGMSQIKATRVIILPQVLRLMLPSWANEAVYMIKNTAIVYLIAVPELMAQTKILISRFYNPIQAYLTVAVFYFVIVGIITMIFAFVENKVKIPGLELEDVR